MIKKTWLLKHTRCNFDVVLIFIMDENQYVDNSSLVKVIVLGMVVSGKAWDLMKLQVQLVCIL